MVQRLAAPLLCGAGALACAVASLAPAVTWVSQRADGADAAQHLGLFALPQSLVGHSAVKVFAVQTLLWVVLAIVAVGFAAARPDRVRYIALVIITFLFSSLTAIVTFAIFFQAVADANHTSQTVHSLGVGGGLEVAVAVMSVLGLFSALNVVLVTHSAPAGDYGVGKSHLDNDEYSSQSYGF